MARISSVEQLRSLYGTPSERAVRKQMDHLDVHCQRFIGLSPFLLLSSSNAEGLGDVSPRGGDAGFVQCLDERTLAIPDSPGNNRLDTLSNLIANPQVGLIFLIPGVDETLRINGPAEIRDDADLCAGFSVNGRVPKAIIQVSVREAYLHCAKALMRSRLWHQETQVERTALPTMGQMLKDQIGATEPPEPQEAMVARYREQLY